VVFKAVVQSVALTDMDKALRECAQGSIMSIRKRFSNMLSEQFPKEGFLLFRLNVGDEFKIISTKIGTNEMENESVLLHNDLNMDSWYGITVLEKMIVKPMSISTGTALRK
jgi:hypothetical protein